MKNILYYAVITDENCNEGNYFEETFNQFEDALLYYQKCCSRDDGCNYMLVIVLCDNITY